MWNTLRTTYSTSAFSRNGPDCYWKSLVSENRQKGEQKGLLQKYHVAHDVIFNASNQVNR